MSKGRECRWGVVYVGCECRGYVSGVCVGGVSVGGYVSCVSVGGLCVGCVCRECECRGCECQGGMCRVCVSGECECRGVCVMSECRGVCVGCVSSVLRSGPSRGIIGQDRCAEPAQAEPGTSRGPAPGGAFPSTQIGLLLSSPRWLPIALSLQSKQTTHLSSRGPA